MPGEWIEYLLRSPTDPNYVFLSRTGSGENRSIGRTIQIDDRGRRPAHIQHATERYVAISRPRSLCPGSCEEENGEPNGVIRSALQHIGQIPQKSLREICRRGQQQRVTMISQGTM